MVDEYDSGFFGTISEWEHSEWTIIVFFWNLFLFRNIQNSTVGIPLREEYSEYEIEQINFFS